MEEITNFIKKSLPNLPDDVMQNTVEALIGIGVSSAEDLMLVEDSDVVGVLKPYKSENCCKVLEVSNHT